MAMKTTKLGDKVMTQAFKYVSVDYQGNRLKGGCYEPKNDNIVYCGEPPTRLIFQTISKNSSGDNAQWCVAFVYFVFAEACEMLGIKNTLPKTASVVTLLEKSKGLFTIDKKASAGSIAIRRTGMTTNKKLADGGNVSHAFIVYAVSNDGKQLIGLEGNSSNMVRMNYYPRAESPYTIDDHLFIHAERMKGGESEVFHPFEFKTITAGTYKSYGEQDLANPQKKSSIVLLKEFK